MSYPSKYRAALLAFGVAQGVIEHYADVFPSIAAIGPFLIPVAIGLLGMHYYFAAKIMDKKVVYTGLAAYIFVLFLFKGMEWGFPKDTAAEQIEALVDEDYVMKHFIFHVVLIGVLTPTCIPFIKKELEGKTVKMN
eukprot:scaffold20031_cov69-Skeletonema_menzelii.AAC.1